MESRVRATDRQFATLLEFMESNGDITKNQPGPLGRLKSDRLWLKLANTLNSVCGGVHKNPDKWKKVWADWKSKTKKKALAMRCHASGTGSGPSSRLSLTTLEERLLGVTGVLAVEGKSEIKEQGFETSPPSTATPISVSEIAAADEVIQPTLSPDPLAPTTPPPSTSREQISARRVSHTFPRPRGPPVSSTSAWQRAARRLQPPSTPSPHSSVASPCRPHLRARQRRVQTPFDRATSEFVAIEQRRLRLEEMRERNESRRIDAQFEFNSVLSRFADIADALLDYHLREPG